VDCCDHDGDDNAAGRELVFGESESDQADGRCDLTCMVAGERAETHFDRLWVVVAVAQYCVTKVQIYDFRDLSSISSVPIFKM
jgi:hypothetical protein